MNPANNLLTPEGVAYINANPNLNLGDLTSLTTTQGVSVTLLVVVFTGLFYFYKKVTAGANLGEVSSSKEGLQRVGGSLLALVVVLGIFSYLGILGKIQELTSLGTTPASGPTPLLAPSPILKETDAGTGPVIKAEGQAQMFEMVKATEVENRSVLAVQKIAINAAACTAIGQANCTSVGGMSNVTLAMLARLKKECSCDITVSGGTEWWAHSASTKHQPGNITAVDLRKSTALDSYIKNNFSKKLSSWSTCYSNYSWNGFVFCDEKPPSSAHWHVEP